MERKSHAENVINLAQKRGVVRACDPSLDRVPRSTLSRLVNVGKLIKIGRGMYALPERQQSENQQLAEVSTRAPSVTCCLLTALRFHQLTTQSSSEIWLAIANKARAPKIDYPPLRVIRFSGDSLTEGVEEHVVDGVTIRVYSVAKTVADCFKYRNKIGLDVALEALKECRRERQASNDELWHFAQVCRVANVMRPYLESVGA